MHESDSAVDLVPLQLAAAAEELIPAGTSRSDLARIHRAHQAVFHFELCGEKILQTAVEPHGGYGPDPSDLSAQNEPQGVEDMDRRMEDDAPAGNG